MEGLDDTQFTAEAVYRFSVSPGFQLAPSGQLISNPVLDPAQDQNAIVGLRTRIAFGPCGGDIGYLFRSHQRAIPCLAKGHLAS